MHRSRNSEVLLRPPSPLYRNRDAYPYDYFSERPLELSRRSRSLECGRDFLRDSYYDEYDDRRFERSRLVNATLPRRRYDYQPYYITSQPRETRFYREEPMRLQAIEAPPTSQHYSPRPVDYEWRFERNFREKSGSPIAPSSPREDYDYQGTTYGQRGYNTWNRTYYKEPATVPAINGPAGGGSGYLNTSNTLNRGPAYLRPQYPKTYPRRDPREQKYRMIHCCCFNFRWPPWGIEETDPPRPMYRHY